MLRIMERGARCKVRGCRYYSHEWCILNVRAETDLITEKCISSDNWYITGSFVLDKVFNQTTAKDIDLVMHEGKKPRKLPTEVLKSPLTVEMLWISGKEPHNLEFQNISLPKITNKGLVNWNMTEDLVATRILSVLPGIKRLPASTIFNAVKSVVKYSLNMDQKCSQIWNKSFLNPLAWRVLTLRIIRYVHLNKDSFDWDEVKVSHLMWYLERAYKDDADHERNLYLCKLLEIMDQMDFGDDKACLLFLRYIRALVTGNTEEQLIIEKSVHPYKV